MKFNRKATINNLFSNKEPKIHFPKEQKKYDIKKVKELLIALYNVLNCHVSINNAIKFDSSLFFKVSPLKINLIRSQKRIAITHTNLKDEQVSKKYTTNKERKQQMGSSNSLSSSLSFPKGDYPFFKI